MTAIDVAALYESDLDERDVYEQFREPNKAPLTVNKAPFPARITASVKQAKRFLCIVENVKT